VLERGANVIDGGLAGFYVKGCGFEEDIGLGGGEPVADVGRLESRFLAISGQECPPHTFLLRTCLEIQPDRVRDPTETPGGEACDAVRHSVALAKVFGPVSKQPDERPVDVAVAEQAEVVSANRDVLSMS
jgi:hypothetical protein